MRFSLHSILLKLLSIFGIIFGVVSLSQKSSNQWLSPHVTASLYALSLLCLIPLLFYSVYNVFKKSSIGSQTFISLLLLFLFALVLDYTFDTHVFAKRKFIREDIFYLFLFISLCSYFISGYEYKISLFYNKLLLRINESVNKSIVINIFILFFTLLLATFNILPKFENSVYIAYFIALCVNVYYFIKMLHVAMPRKEIAKNEIYLLFPAIMFVVSVLLLINSFFHKVDVFTPYYCVLYATILLVINFLVIIYFIQQILSKKYGLLNYIISITVYYAILSFPFFIMVYRSWADIYVQYFNGALLYPALFLMVSLFTNSFKLSHDALNYKVVILIVNILNRMIYSFFLLGGIAGAVTYEITGGDIFYNTYSIMFIMLSSIHNPFPVHIMLLGLITIVVLVLCLYYLFYFIDRLFQNRTYYLLNGFKFAKFINIARLVFAFGVIFVGYNIYSTDSIGKKFFKGYFLYLGVNHELQNELSSSQNNMPILNYSNNTNIPRRNLVIIHLESMDKVNAENQNFENLMPTLANFSNVGIDFVENKQIYGQKFSYAGVKMSHCGVITILSDKTKCLGNVLHDYGYYQEFIRGWSMSTLNFDEIFKTLQYDKTYGYFELKKFLNQNPKVLNNFSPTIKDTGYSYSDSAVFGFAFNEFDRLYANNTQKPFVLTLFTSDNHVYYPTQDSYSCNDSLVKYKGVGSDLLIYQVLHCQDDLIRRYVEHIRSVDVNNNTAIIIIGDHLAHYSDNLHQKLNRDEVYFIILNSGYKAQKIEYEVGNYDMAPITLNILGIFQNQTKSGVDVTHFLQGFDVLQGMQTDEGKEYLKNRKPSAMVNNLTMPEIAFFRSWPLRHDLMFLDYTEYVTGVSDVLKLIDNDSKFSKLYSDNDLQIDCYHSIQHLGNQYLFRMKFNNSAVNYKNIDDVRKFLGDTEFSLTYDTDNAVMKYNVASYVDYCDVNYCYFGYIDHSMVNSIEFHFKYKFPGEHHGKFDKQLLVDKTFG